MQPTELEYQLLFHHAFVDLFIIIIVYSTQFNLSVVFCTYKDSCPDTSYTFLICLLAGGMPLLLMQFRVRVSVRPGDARRIVEW